MSVPYPMWQISRPVIITFIGVLSIILASISFFVNFSSLIFASGLVRISAMTAAPIAAPVPAPIAISTHAEYVAPQGLSSEQRQVVINGLSQLRPLSDEKQKQLDGLLADVGQTVIRLSPENLTTDRVTTYVTEVREIPSGSGGPPDDMFILGSGRLQLSDQSAVFFPDNSPSPIRSGGGSFTDSAGTHLAEEQIAAVVDRARNLCNQTMNDAQATSLEAELESVSQTLITPSPSVAQAAGQVLSAQSLPDGTIAVTTKTGSMSFGPAGQSFPGVTAVGAMRGPWRGPGLSVARTDATLLMLDAILCFFAAAFLLACGIMMLRNSSPSRWMHLGYAAGKLALSMLSCYAIYSVAVELDAKSADAQSTALAWMLIVGASGAVYPVVLLIAMNLKSVKEFLGAPTVARIF